MKIEMAESLLRSWLRHVRCCEFAELNWKPSPEWLPKCNVEPDLFNDAIALWPDAFGNNSYDQLLRQAEVDILGLSFHDNHLYFIDVAFHISGLNYGDKAKTGMRVFKKLIRSALIAKRYFPDQTACIMFVSPFTNPNMCTELENVKEKLEDLVEKDQKLNFEFFLSKSDFKRELIEPLLSLGKGVADTSELFLRSWQLIEPFFEKYSLENATSDVEADKQMLPTPEVNRRDLLLSALYLAKFGHLNSLDFPNQTQSINGLAEIIGCSANSLRGFRDRYDRYVDSPRVGYDLPLSDELKSVLLNFNAYTEEALRAELPN